MMDYQNIARSKITLHFDNSLVLQIIIVLIFEQIKVVFYWLLMDIIISFVQYGIFHPNIS